MKKLVPTKLEPEDIEKLKSVAKKQGHTISSLIRKIILDFLNSIK